MVGWVGIGGARLRCLGVLMPRGWLFGGMYAHIIKCNRSGQSAKEHIFHTKKT
jgi:hypothetical protein